MNAGLAITTYATLLYLAPGVGYAGMKLLQGDVVAAAVGLVGAVLALAFALAMFAAWQAHVSPGRTRGVRLR
ncbi:hypothetical protein [Haloarcula sp. JP-L23]|uniref:hypothetical protein n=1 Tax=Haloarcula sp. JP-L23 TaxID=2716717 RepID=UPI00140E9E4F|nr:hypothetical protein G9465_25020 [Haloarcula sp. JP-L23]